MVLVQVWQQDLCNAGDQSKWSCLAEFQTKFLLVLLLLKPWGKMSSMQNVQL